MDENNLKLLGYKELLDELNNKLKALEMHKVKYYKFDAHKELFKRIYTDKAECAYKINEIYRADQMDLDLDTIDRITDEIINLDKQIKTLETIISEKFDAKIDEIDKIY